MNFFKKDPWLSTQLNKPSFTVINVGAMTPTDGSFQSELNKITSQHGSLFIQCKVQTDNLEAIRLLEQCKFNLTDTNVVFKKEVNQISNIVRRNDQINMRSVNSSDKITVMSIANRNFKYSRFHIDPCISSENANKLKSEWVANYFKGERGDHMVVSEINGAVSGFVQLLVHDDHYVIDLIAVDRDFQRMGIAQSMLDYCDELYQKLKYSLVGTQISNIGSINLYLKKRYRFHSGKYVFHFNK